MAQGTGDCEEAISNSPTLELQAERWDGDGFIVEATDFMMSQKSSVIGEIIGDKMGTMTVASLTGELGELTQKMHNMHTPTVL